MAGLEELLEGLADEGVREGTGTFTLAAHQVWKGLSRSLTGPGDLPRFALRWLAGRPERPGRLMVEIKGREVCFRAAQTKARLDRPPDLDYSGSDLELARALVAAQQLGVSSAVLVMDGWEGEAKEASPVVWKGERGDPNGDLSLRLFLPRGVSRGLAADWKKRVWSRLAYCPIPLSWNRELLTRSVRFSSPPLVWRRLLPPEKSFPLLDFRPPEEALAHFVVPRHAECEVLLGLGPSGSSSIRLVHHGDLFSLSRPGFLPGFEIVIHSPRLSLDMEGKSVVANQSLERLLASFREEAYDMMLQLYRADPPPTAETVAAHLAPLGSILIYLLDQRRYVEGHLLAVWADERMGTTAPGRGLREGYTFYRTAAILAQQANHPLTARRLDGKAQALRESVSDESADVESALIDAYLDSRARADQRDRLGHHIRSRLHLLAVRCGNQQRNEEAFRLYHVLLSSLREIGPDHLDLWFETARLAAELGKFGHLKGLLRRLKRSQERGAVTLSPAVRARANSFADVVKRSES